MQKKIENMMIDNYGGGISINAEPAAIRKKTMGKVLLLAIVFCCMGFAGEAQTTYYYQSGDFTVAANWNTDPGGAGTTPADFTNAADTWVVATDLDINAPWTLPAHYR